ncbi:hypothetical protein DFH09DRAFT_1435844 [Mycena vulgaris]|nr:hypothetical protein DFH09DRAFT_1435844 [Mycena vulgaris]
MSDWPRPNPDPMALSDEALPSAWISFFTETVQGHRDRFNLRRCACGLKVENPAVKIASQTGNLYFERLMCCAPKALNHAHAHPSTRCWNTYAWLYVGALLHTPPPLPSSSAPSSSRPSFRHALPRLYARPHAARSLPPPWAEDLELETAEAQASTPAP